MCIDDHIDLNVLILKTGKKKHEIARNLNWHLSKISNILNGIYTPSSMEKEDFAKELGCPVEEAFPSGRREAF